MVETKRKKEMKTNCIATINSIVINGYNHNKEVIGPTAVERNNCERIEG